MQGEQRVAAALTLSQDSMVRSRGVSEFRCEGLDGLCCRSSTSASGSVELGAGFEGRTCALHGQRSHEVGDDLFVSLYLSHHHLFSSFNILLRQFNEDIVWPSRPDPKCEQIQTHAPIPSFPKRSSVPDSEFSASQTGSFLGPGYAI